MKGRHIGNTIVPVDTQKSISQFVQKPFVSVKDNIDKLHLGSSHHIYEIPKDARIFCLTPSEEPRDWEELE